MGVCQLYLLIGSETTATKALRGKARSADMARLFSSIKNITYLVWEEHKVKNLVGHPKDNNRTNKQKT